MTRCPSVPRRSRTNGWALAAAMTAGIGIALLTGVPAARAQTGACATVDDGVTVVVDLTALGGNVAVECAPGAPANGLAALSAAGFSWVEVQSLPGFVCRINGLPADDPCVNTPPADAFWSYWVADRGGAWSFSAMGAASRTPAVGSVEGWAFALGAPGGVAPSVPPPGQPLATTTTTAPSATTTTVATTTTTAVVTTVTAPPTTSAPTTTTSAPAVAAGGVTTSSSPTPPPVPAEDIEPATTAAPTAADTAATAAQPVDGDAVGRVSATERDDGVSARGPQRPDGGLRPETAAAGIAVAAVGAVAIVTARRRTGRQ